jgi:hypothetical protein
MNLARCLGLCGVYTESTVLSSPTAGPNPDISNTRHRLSLRKLLYHFRLKTRQVKCVDQEVDQEVRELEKDITRTCTYDPKGSRSDGKLIKEH